MNKNEIKQVIHFFLEKIESLDINYRLGGSVNLFVQGMQGLNPKDVDIMPDKKSFEILKNKLKDHISHYGYKNDLKGPYFTIIVGGFELDVFTFDDDSKSLLDKKKIVKWEEMELPVLSLDDTIIYFQNTNRPQKAEQIREFLLKK